MLYQIRCPQGHVLGVDPAHVGLKVQCPACKVIMIVPELPGAPRGKRTEVPTSAGRPKHQTRDDRYDEDDDDQDDRPKTPNKRTRMRRVSTGLSFHKAKVITVIVTVIIMMTVAVFLNLMAVPGQRGRGGLGPGVFQLATYFQYFAFFMSIVITSLGLTGSFYCMSIPSESGGKELIIISFAIDVLILPLTLFNQLVQQNDIIAYAIVALALIAYITFFVFLARLGSFLRKSALSKKASNLMIQVIVVPILSVVIFVLTMATGMGMQMGGGGAFLVSCAILVFVLGVAGWAIYWVIQYLRLLTALQDNIRA